MGIKYMRMIGFASPFRYNDHFSSLFQVIGANHVSVPTHFFKVIVGETDTHSLEMEAYVLPNQVI